MKYKIGDKVRIKSDLIVGKTYKGEDGMDSCYVVQNMLKYQKQTATIIRVLGNGRGYKIDLDNGSCVWTYEMLEDSFLSDGYLVKLKNGKFCIYKNKTFYGKDGFKRQLRCYDKETLKHKTVDDLSVCEVYSDGDVNNAFSMQGRKLITLYNN